MNNNKIYGKKFSAYSEAQAAYNAQREDFEKWALARANTHIFNAKRILAKYNRGRDNAIGDIPGLPWLDKRLTFKEFGEDGLIYTYQTIEKARNSWSKDRTVTVEFKFPTAWLSLSIWDFNKAIREACKKEIAEGKRRREDAAIRAQMAEVNELRKKLRAATAEADKIRTQIAGLDKALSL